MNECESNSGNNGALSIQRDWDVETIIEQILSELKGAFTRSIIQEVLDEIIPRYDGARIQTYVPIFIRRDAINRLKSMKANFAESEMAIYEANETNDNQADFESQRRIVRDEQNRMIGVGLMLGKSAT